MGEWSRLTAHIQQDVGFSGNLIHEHIPLDAIRVQWLSTRKPDNPRWVDCTLPTGEFSSRKVTTFLEFDCLTFFTTLPNSREILIYCGMLFLHYYSHRSPPRGLGHCELHCFGSFRGRALAADQNHGRFWIRQSGHRYPCELKAYPPHSRRSPWCSHLSLFCPEVF